MWVSRKIKAAGACTNLETVRLNGDSAASGTGSGGRPEGLMQEPKHCSSSGSAANPVSRWGLVLWASFSRITPEVLSVALGR